MKHNFKKLLVLALAISSVSAVAAGNSTGTSHSTTTAISITSIDSSKIATREGAGLSHSVYNTPESSTILDQNYDTQETTTTGGAGQTENSYTTVSIGNRAGNVSSSVSNTEGLSTTNVDTTRGFIKNVVGGYETSVIQGDNWNTEEGRFEDLIVDNFLVVDDYSTEYESTTTTTDFNY